MPLAKLVKSSLPGVAYVSRTMASKLKASKQLAAYQVAV
jgi:hypothetical protein